jgi:hypothetical protein
MLDHQGDWLLAREQGVSPTRRCYGTNVVSFPFCRRMASSDATEWRRLDADLTEAAMHGIIYLVGLIVVIMAILSFFGLR